MADFNNRIPFYMTNSYVDERGSDARIRERLLAMFSVGRDSGKTVAYELTDEDYFGLLRYDRLSCPTPWECRKFDEEYLNKATGSPAVHIRCTAQILSSKDERVGCRASTLYRGFDLVFSIPRSQLSRWSEFDSGLRRQLDRFTQDAEQR